jgi:hypothetical protein
LPAGFTAEITALVNDETRLTRLGENADRTRANRSAERTAAAYATAWSDLLAKAGQP